MRKLFLILSAFLFFTSNACHASEFPFNDFATMTDSGPLRTTGTQSALAGSGTSRFGQYRQSANLDSAPAGELSTVWQDTISGGSHPLRWTHGRSIFRGGDLRTTQTQTRLGQSNVQMAGAQPASSSGFSGLPATTLDSFVRQSGYNDHIYGDESVDGPPPYQTFGVINDGIGSSKLTTGRPFPNLPSAWY